MMAVAMHCNLRPPDDAPVVLDFNYEVLNTLGLLQTSANPQCTHTSNYDAIEQSAAEFIAI